MAALKSPFSGENMNLQILIEKIERCEYSELPEEIYSFEVRNQVIGHNIKRHNKEWQKKHRKE